MKKIAYEKTYVVTYDVADYEYQIIRVQAMNKREARKAVENMYGYTEGRWKPRIHSICEVKE